MPSATIVLTEPTYFDVAYAINPWMDPLRWGADPVRNKAAAEQAWLALSRSLDSEGVKVVKAPPVPGLPDMVFPANSAVVLDGRALVGRFRHKERRAESEHYGALFDALRDQGLLSEVSHLPAGLHQEGAGDCMWDPTRRLFWAGFGPRSCRGAAAYLAEHFGVEVLPLELVSPQFYHLDVCFVPLSGGEVAYFPEAFSTESLELIRSRIPTELRLEVNEREARSFALNAVNIGKAVLTTGGAERLTGELARRGYRCVSLELDPFILAGGAAFCMTLRLDHRSSRVALPSDTGCRTAPG